MFIGDYTGDRYKSCGVAKNGRVLRPQCGSHQEGNDADSEIAGHV